MTQPGPEHIQTAVDLPTYQAQLKRLIGDRLAEDLMDRAMMASQVEVLHGQLQQSRQETIDALSQAQEPDLPQSPPSSQPVTDGAPE